jgi:hypothetical protein
LDGFQEARRRGRRKSTQEKGDKPARSNSKRYVQIYKVTIPLFTPPCHTTVVVFTPSKLPRVMLYGVLAITARI